MKAKASEHAAKLESALLRSSKFQVFYFVLFDCLAIGLSFFVSLILRFDLQYSAIPNNYLRTYTWTILPHIAFCIGVFGMLHLYRSIWRYASYSELLRMIVATIITGGCHVVFQCLFFTQMPFAYYIFGIVLQFCTTTAVRFFYRFVLLLKGRHGTGDCEKKNIMLIGGGESGQMILRDVKSQQINESVCCIIDDNPNKIGRYIDGIRIVGNRDTILENVKKYHIDKIYVAIPSATAEQRRDILNICKETSCELKNLPGMYQLMTGKIKVSAMEEVSIEDLLGREQIKVNVNEIADYVRNKVVLITGVGSIGSELARQVAEQRPSRLILFDIYENNAYAIQLELKKKYPYLDIVTLIGSVRDTQRIFSVFRTYRPNIVYHAAAHKHVPLMEDSPYEAIKNNVGGTYKTAMAALVFGCDRFVMISTDKAVNPTNIMGASKRLCEMIIQTFDHKIKSGQAESLFAPDEDAKHYLGQPELVAALRQAKTEFVAVRFGNVLGSNGSVVPLFKEQIRAGGPVTVTHPDIIRYFMTIPEAVCLVLQAGAYAKGGEIFILDMGEPVKIDTLARNLIKLSGFVPDQDIKIEYTGLRPGEKLFEEKLMAEEGLQRTENALIHIGQPIPFDTDTLIKNVLRLKSATMENDEVSVIETVKQIVVTYHPA